MIAGLVSSFCLGCLPVSEAPKPVQLLHIGPSVSLVTLDLEAGTSVTQWSTKLEPSLKAETAAVNEKNVLISASSTKFWTLLKLDKHSGRILKTATVKVSEFPQVRRYREGFIAFSNDLEQDFFVPFSNRERLTSPWGTLDDRSFQGRFTVVSEKGILLSAVQRTSLRAEYDGVLRVYRSQSSGRKWRLLQTIEMEEGVGPIALNNQSVLVQESGLHRMSLWRLDGSTGMLRRVSTSRSAMRCRQLSSGILKDVFYGFDGANLAGFQVKEGRITESRIRVSDRFLYTVEILQHKSLIGVLDRSGEVRRLRWSELGGLVSEGSFWLKPGSYFNLDDPSFPINDDPSGLDDSESADGIESGLK